MLCSMVAQPRSAGVRAVDDGVRHDGSVQSVGSSKCSSTERNSADIWEGAGESRAVVASPRTLRTWTLAQVTVQGRGRVRYQSLEI